jgi:YhcN/YlaJ family sporulation lipoprotein
VKYLQVACCCLLFFILTACSSSNQADENHTTDRSSQIHVKDSAEESINRESGQKIASHLVELSSGIPGVRDATAVVIGKYAIVGIDVDAKLDRSRVSTIKYSVTEILKHDPHGANAIVIADVDTYERLKQMKKQIQDGRPVVGVLDELAQIVGRIIPTIPNEAIDNQNTNPTDTNNPELNKQEQKQLHQKQNEQSNHKKTD